MALTTSQIRRRFERRIPGWTLYVAALFSLVAQLWIWLSFFNATDRGETGASIPLDVGLSFVLVVVLGGSAVSASSRRGLVVAIANGFATVLFAFSQEYWIHGTSTQFSGVHAPMTQLDALYFAIGTLTTAGTGSLSALSETVRELQTFQMLIDFVLVAVILAMVVARLLSRDQR